jgi:hypothetical protein
MLYKFGTGSLIAVPSGTNPTPVEFGALQDVSIDVQFTNKELYGQSQFPLAVARGTGKITGKASFAQINGDLYNSVFFNQTVSAGQTKIDLNVAATVPAVTTYTVSATPPSSGAYAKDMGVKYQNGTPFTRVAAGSEAAGLYSVDESTGVYTFAAADASAAIYYSYEYTVSASGKTLTLTNQLQGVAPTFQARFQTTYNGKSAYWKLWAVVANKLSMPSKMSDWNMDQFDFDAFQDDATGNVITISLAE